MSNVMSAPDSPKQHHLLKKSNFLFLLLGGTTSMIGYRLYLIAMSWFVVSIFGSSAILGVLFVCWAIPNTIFMLIGGPLADRYNKVNIMFTSDLSRSLILFLLTLVYALGLLKLWNLLVISTLFGVSNAMFIPSRDSLLPALVEQEELRKANSYKEMLGQTAFILGPLLGALAVKWLGVGFSFLVPAFVILLSAIFIKRITYRNAPQNDTKVNISELLAVVKSGFLLVKSKSSLIYLFASMAIFNLGYYGPLTVGLPTLTNKQLVSGVGGFSTLEAALATGMVVGSLLFSRMKVKRVGVTIFVATMLAGAIFSQVGSFHSLPVVALLLVLVGGLITVINISIYATVQQQIPGDMLGTAFGFLNFIVISLDPVTFFLSGIGFDVMSIKHCFLVSGGIIFMTGLFGLFIRSVRIL